MIEHHHELSSMDLKQLIDNGILNKEDECFLIIAPKQEKIVKLIIEDKYIDIETIKRFHESAKRNMPQYNKRK